MIELNVLEEINHEDLKSVGITRLVQRNKKLKEIRKVKSHDTVKNFISGPTFSEFSCNFCDQNFPTPDLLQFLDSFSHVKSLCHCRNLFDAIQMHVCKMNKTNLEHPAESKRLNTIETFTEEELTLECNSCSNECNWDTLLIYHKKSYS